jgi:thioredoxin 1
MKRLVNNIIGSALISFLVLTGLCAASPSAPTVEDLYPGLASQSLKFAQPAKLPKGTLLTAGSLTIQEAEIIRAVSQAGPEMKKQLAHNAFFLLENLATSKLLLQEAYQAGNKKEKDEHQVIMKFIGEKVKADPVTENELKTFYNENRDLFGGAPLEQVKEALKGHLAQQKRQEALQAYIQNLGQRSVILVDAEWVKKQSLLARDNPVDRARLSGRPSLIDFGATGCGPCDMMTPILDKLKKKYQGKLNVLFVHVQEEKVFSSRYGIRSIPVQVFFDKNGTEFFRHTGFFPELEIERKLAQLGLAN